MSHRLPERVFHPLDELADHWSVSPSDIRQWLAGGILTAVLWLPAMTVIPRTGRGCYETETTSFEHWQGYVPISEHQCDRVFRRGWTALREFTSPDRTRIFRLPETADDLIVELADLVVLEAERKRMEDTYPGLRNSGRAVVDPLLALADNVIDPTFRTVRIGGREYRFGETQAAVLRQLADAARHGEPWQSGKLLLSRAGSRSFSISNLFKRHPVWRNLVVSNRRGFYRLESRFLTEQDQFRLLSQSSVQP